MAHSWFVHSPENGCRRYRSFLPFTRNFFGTGGSDDRRSDESLFSLLLIWPFTCFSNANYNPNQTKEKTENHQRNNLLEFQLEFIERMYTYFHLNYFTCEPKRMRHLSNMHLNNLVPPCDRTCRSSHLREHDSRPCTLQLAQRHENGSVCELTCFVCKWSRRLELVSQFSLQSSQ